MAGLGILFSPFAAIVLQAMNYSSLDHKSAVRSNVYWFVGLFLSGLVWAELPLPLSPQDRFAASIAYSVATFFVWFIFYGRKYRKRVGEEVLVVAPVRSGLLGLAIAIGVWIATAVASVCVILVLDRVLRPK